MALIVNIRVNENVIATLGIHNLGTSKSGTTNEYEGVIVEGKTVKQDLKNVIHDYDDGAYRLIEKFLKQIK